MKMFLVIGSLKTKIPTAIAVTGSNTPKIDAFIEPILFADAIKVSIEIAVGKIAKPRAFRKREGIWSTFP
ncbi:MAG TPA: hypothetical protein DDY68_06360, partial [Porphyromonadaceae bacterium]|nr:hypothetical protein [Porphyromonadaceae bacterium]